MNKRAARLFLVSGNWYNKAMEKFTQEQLNTMDKDALVTLVMSCMDRIRQLTNENAEQTRELNHKIDNLTETIALLTQRSFGKKSEVKLYSGDQLTIYDMGINEAEVTLAGRIPREPEIEEVVIKEHKRAKRKGKREEDLAGLPVTIVNHVLDEERLNELFPEGYSKLPDEVYKKLEVKPAVFEVKEHHIAVYKGKNGKIAKGNHPKEAISNSVASPSILAFVSNAKYVNAIPLYRLEQEFLRNDISISRQVMAHWMIYIAEHYLSLIHYRLIDEIKRSSVVHADETPVSVVKDGREGMHNSYMWVYRNGGLKDNHHAVVYDFHKTRKKEAPAEFLRGFKGTLVTDGYQVYHSLENDKSTEFTVAGCWAHAKRKFAEIIKALGEEKAKSTVAYEAVGQIQYLYHRDNELMYLKPGERHRKRQVLIKPIVDDFFRWAREIKPRVSSSSATGKALNYCLNQEKHLRVFLDNPEIPLDNNAAERAIRPFCVGKKNWKLIDTVHGAEASAIIYSIVETCKLNGLNIFYYLKHVLTEMPKYMDDSNQDFIEALLPWSDELPDECRKKK